MFQTFDHTADLGLRIQAADLDTLFAEAGQALFSAIVEDLGSVQPAETLEVNLAGNDLVYLLFDWLNELLYRWDAEHKLFSRFEVKFEPASPGAKDRKLIATARGEVLDRDRHVLSHEVKAITYHGLVVEPTEAGWQAEVIVDI
ncbi:MAG: archease [Gemmataceae bacterium]